MLTTKELRVIEIFRKDLSRQYSIRKIMQEIGVKSYSWIFNVIKKLEKEGVITIKKQGASEVCAINLESAHALRYIAILEYESAESSKDVPKQIIRSLTQDIPIAYYSFIVTGSFAAGRQKRGSDIDVCVIIEDGVNKKMVSNYFANKGELMMPRVHPFVFTKTEFLQMLLDKGENYGKLLHRKKLIYFGAENYYMIIREAISHGFRG